MGDADFDGYPSAHRDKRGAVLDTGVSGAPAGWIVQDVKAFFTNNDGAGKNGTYIE
jgi:hypothetical protein